MQTGMAADHGRRREKAMSGVPGVPGVPGGVMTPDHLAALLGELAAVPGGEMTVQTGSGAQARLRGSQVHGVEVGTDGVALVTDGWRLWLDAAPVERAAVVETRIEGADGAKHGVTVLCDFRLLDHLSQEVLRVERREPSKEAGLAGQPAQLAPPDAVAFWRAFATRQVGVVRTVEVRLTRGHGGARISRDLALRIFSDLLESKRVTFDVTTGESSAEVFANLPLHDPHYGEGWLLAGEPERRDAHLHVRSSQIAAVRFCERHKAGGRVQRVARILDARGYALCDGWFEGPRERQGRKDSGAGMATGGGPARAGDARTIEEVFVTLRDRYAWQPGVELEVEQPLSE